MWISEIMTEHVGFVTPHDTLQDAAIKMKELGVGPLPVCEHQSLVGIVTDRDITIRAVAEGLDPKATKVHDVMSGDLICCYEDQDVGVAARLMESQQIRRLLVLNRDKRLVGIVSLGDLAVHAETPQRAGEILQEVSGSATAHD
jgi:CBS domain-containing protein